MKVVLLLAGRGRRLGDITKSKNKALIELLGKPILGHLLDRFLLNNLGDIIPVVGYDKDKVIEYMCTYYGKDINLIPVINPRFEKTNNLYSLWCAKDILANDSFIVCNGDLILNKVIIANLLDDEHKSCIAIDDKNKDNFIDSPKTIIRDGRIYDLGRYIPHEQSSGYAIGLYKFGKELIDAFFAEADKMFEKSMYNAGFHDPLIPLFGKYEISWVSTNGLSWSDIDTPQDIPYAQRVLEKILLEESG